MTEPMELEQQKMSLYLSDVFRKPVRVETVKKLGTGVLGWAYLLDATVDGQPQSLVLKMAKGAGFGQDYPADRAATLIYANSVYNRLPRHVRSYDVGAITENGALKNLGDSKEFFILMEYVRGTEYAADLDRIAKRRNLLPIDEVRTDLLAKYVADIHAVKSNQPELYIRRVRDLLGRGDCIAGIIDSYPQDERTYSFTNNAEFEEIERKCVGWRWKLRRMTHRLSQVHGDLHPFNIIWQGPETFTLLDRSRGEWGEPADDVTALAINYIFWSLSAYGSLQGPFERLYRLFYERYLELTGDVALEEVVQPFYAFRALVIANPIFYPSITVENRRRLFNFINAVLESERFDPREVNSYLKG